jgi:hypothetical protein
VSVEAHVCDICFSDDSWSAPLGETMSGISESLLAARELDLATIAIAVAVAVGCQTACRDESPRAGLSTSELAPGASRLRNVARSRKELSCE